MTSTARARSLNRNAVPALLLSPDFDRNVVPELLLQRQRRDDVVAGTGMPGAQVTSPTARTAQLRRWTRASVRAALLSLVASLRF